VRQHIEFKTIPARFVTFFAVSSQVSLADPRTSVVCLKVTCITIPADPTH
jgi:hypothetical protein